MEGIVLSPKIERETEKRLAQIAGSDSMIIAAKTEARAEGLGFLDSIGPLIVSYATFEVKTRVVERFNRENGVREVTEGSNQAYIY